MDRLTEETWYLLGGGAIRINTGGQVTHCLITGCITSVYNSAIQISGASPARVSHCIVRNNSVRGISVESPCLIENCIIEGNYNALTSQDAGGLYLGAFAFVPITARNCLIANNSYGGGVAHSGTP